MEDELYRQELLERYKNAHNKKIMIKPDIKSEDSNPLCGDHIEIFLRVGKDGKINEATFEGKGCVISMASASLLMDHLVGKTLKEAEETTREDMLDIIRLNLTPTRVKCATLGLSTVKKGISEDRLKENTAAIFAARTNAKADAQPSLADSTKIFQGSVTRGSELSNKFENSPGKKIAGKNKNLAGMALTEKTTVQTKKIAKSKTKRKK